MSRQRQPFLLTPEQHRERAARLRRMETAKALELAAQHDLLAKAIEKRLEKESAAFPLAPA